MNIVVMATGEFALPGLKALIESEHSVSALITQPDRVNPRGVVHPHPLKEYAISQGIPVFQPDSINTEGAIQKLKSLRPEVVIVGAYGQILSAEVINVPTKGTYNLHASLLPRHRGAAPIQYAIWKGDDVTGVTIFRIEPKLDAGPMIVKLETTINPTETSGQLHDRLAIVGAEAILEAVRLIESDEAKPLLQDDSLVTKSPKIKKSEGEINWSQTPREIDCHIRAMQPWPKPFTFLHRAEKKPERILVLKISKPDEGHSESNCPPGTILEAERNQLCVQTGDGPVIIEQIQKAGKKMMTPEEFLRGNTVTAGDYFGSETT